jgi:hypothetical protein
VGPEKPCQLFFNDLFGAVGDLLGHASIAPIHDLYVRLKPADSVVFAAGDCGTATSAVFVPA